jgi:hypothetical protein
VSGNTFIHPRNATPAKATSAAYWWSEDLATFRATGATDLDGTTVTFVATPDTSVPGITTVITTVTGTDAASLFVRVQATKDRIIESPFRTCDNSDGEHPSSQ